MHYFITAYLKKTEEASISPECRNTLYFGKPRSTRTTQLMKELHWLPIKQRIQFKVGCPMHKVKNKNAPAYLQSLFRLNVNSANPNRREMFQVPTGRTNIQKAAFENSGGLFWNGLPIYLRIELNYKVFKQMLKTSLLILIDALLRSQSAKASFISIIYYDFAYWFAINYSFAERNFSKYFNSRKAIAGLFLAFS